VLETLSCRAAILRPGTFNESARTVEAVLATDNPVVSQDAKTGKGVFEVWCMAGAELPESVPLFDNHQRASVRNVIGTVTNIRTTPDGQLIGTLNISEAERGVFTKIKEGHLRDVSGGVQTNAADNIRAGQTRSYFGRNYTAPQDRDLRIVTSWRLREVSLTPFGADPQAKIRSQSDKDSSISVSSSNGEMLRRSPDFADTLHLRVPDTLHRWAALLGLKVRHDVDDLTFTRSALSNPALSGMFTTEISSRVVTGYGAVRDTTVGVVSEIPSDTFKESEIGTLEEGARLKKLSRGRPAEHIDFRVSPTSRTLTRYAAQFVADEQSLIDSGTTTRAVFEAVADIGRAAKRNYLDLVWSTILKNPELYDGVDMFHADHDNRLSGGSSALSATSLASAVSSIAGQVITLDGRPIHLGLSSAFLFVPPALISPARVAVRNYMLDGDASNLTVVPESRISSVGVLDPTDDATVVTGVDTNWLVAAPSTQRPAVIVSFLTGSSTAPQIESFSIEEPGQWGTGWAIKQDIGCHVIDFRPWVYSVGA
jgi:hypothetical protein